MKIEDLQVSRVGSRGAEFVKVTCSLHDCNKVVEKSKKHVEAYKRIFCGTKCYMAFQGVKKPRPAFDCRLCGKSVKESTTYEYRASKLCDKCEYEKQRQKVEDRKVRQQQFIEKWRLHEWN